MKQKLKLVTPLATEDVSKKENTIITNGVHNAAYNDKVEALRNVLPMTEVGIGIALSDINSAKILGALDKKKIAQIRDIMGATKAWYNALVSYGMSDKDASTYSGRLLGLAPAMISSLGLDSEKTIVAEELLRDLWKTPALSEVYVTLLNGMPKVTKIKTFNGTRDVSINTLNEVLGYSLDYLRTEGSMSSIEAVISSFVDTKLGDLNDKEKSDARDLTMKELLSQKAYKPLFTADMMNLYFEIFIQSRIVQATTGLEGVWQNIVKLFDGKFSLGDLDLGVSTTLPFLVWNKVIIGIMESDDFKDEEWGKMNIISSKSMEALKNRFSQNLTTKTADGINDLFKALSGIQTFSQSLSDFYSNKTGFLIESYRNTEQLMAAHKRFLNGLVTATDVASAREAFTKFAHSSESPFTKSLAGLLFAIINNQDTIDPLLVSDILGISINEDVIRSFKDSPFGKDINLSTMNGERISDYGAGVAGYTLKGEVNVHTKVVFEEDGNIVFNGHRQSDIQQIFVSPSSNKDNQSAFCKMAMLFIGNPDVHSMLSGSTELSSYTKGYVYSTSIREEMLPMVRLINNCVGAQLFAHKTASLEWLKQQQFGVVDMCNYAINYLNAEKNNIKTRLYSDVTIANLTKIRDVATESLKTLFGVDVPKVRERALPYVTFYIGGSSQNFLVTDVDQIVSHMISTFRRPTHDTLRLIEEMKSNIRAINALSKEGVEYKRSNNAMYLKSSLVEGFKALMSLRTATFEDTDFNAHLALKPNLAHVRAYKNDAFRDDTGVRWFQGGSLPLLLDNVLANKRNLTSLQEISGDRFGVHAKNHFYLNPFIIQFAKAKAIDLLNKVYLSSYQASSRSARAMFKLNHMTQALLRLSTSPYEGLEYGFSPLVETFTTTSNAYTLEYILSSIGIKSGASVLVKDGTFFYMVQQIGELGGPIRLNESGKLALEAAYKNKSIIIEEAVELNPNIAMTTSNVMTVSFYLRTPEMMASIYNDYLIEDISKSYDIMLVEDSIITALKSSSFDDMVLTLSSEYPLDLADIETESDFRAALHSAASMVADFLFPFGAVNPKSDDESSNDDGSNDDDGSENEE